MLEAAHTYIGKGASKRYATPWWNETCSEGLQERRKAHKAAGSGTKETMEAYKLAARRVADVFDAASADAWKTYVEGLDIDTGPAEVWGTVHTLAGQGDAFKALPAFKVGDKVMATDRAFNVGDKVMATDRAFKVGDKVMATDRAKADALATQYAGVSTIPGLDPQAERLLRKKNGEALSPEEVERSRRDDTMGKPFTKEELKAALKAIKAGKATGPDEARNEWMHHLGPLGRQALLDTANESWATGQVPQAWRRATIPPLLKTDK
eukprot:gene11114-gene1429